MHGCKRTYLHAYEHGHRCSQHTHIQTKKKGFIHNYIHTYTYKHADINICKQTFTECADTCTHKCMHVYTYICSRTKKDAHMYIYIYICVYTYQPRNADL